jgi:hypothetical protein
MNIGAIVNMNIGAIVNWFGSHQEQVTAGVAVAILAVHTIAKGWQDSLGANKDKTGADKIISSVLGTLAYIFGGVRS